MHDSRLEQPLTTNDITWCVSAFTRKKLSGNNNKKRSSINQVKCPINNYVQEKNSFSSFAHVFAQPAQVRIFLPGQDQTTNASRKARDPFRTRPTLNFHLLLAKQYRGRVDCDAWFWYLLLLSEGQLLSAAIATGTVVLHQPGRLAGVWS